MTLNKVVLELDADIDDDGLRETGVFEMVGNLEVQHGVDVGHTLLSGRGSALNAIYGSTVDKVGDLLEKDAPKPSRRRGLYLDVGGGKHYFEVNFLGWDGAIDADDNPVQWGVPIGKSSYQTPEGGSYATTSEWDATGDPPLHQEQVFQQFLRVGEYDSRAEHARVRYGEYSDGTFSSDGQDGLFDDYIHVTVESSMMNKSAEGPTSFDGSVRLAETRGWRDALDAIARLK